MVCQTPISALASLASALPSPEVRHSIKRNNALSSLLVEVSDLRTEETYRSEDELQDTSK